jgi:predicted nucleic acid-binding protein
VRVEVPAALWRKERIGELAVDSASVLVRDFEVDVLGDDESSPRFAVVAVSPALLDAAAGLLPTHDLRTLDAIQLASARAARDADSRCTGFVCFDERLREAAAREGFELTPA